MALIKIGQTPINKIFFGKIKITKIYFNNNLIFNQKQE